MNRQSDFISFDTGLRKGFDLLKHEKTAVIGFYIVFSINAGLRVGDVLKLKHSDLKDKKEGDTLLVTEQKTNKLRQVTINHNVFRGYHHLVNTLRRRNRYVEDGFIFVSQKNCVYSTRSLNRLLKSVFPNKDLNISTHSTRKAFGRRVYNNNAQSEHSLVLLSEIFGHSSIAVTRRYLGLRQQEIKDVYLSL